MLVFFITISCYSVANLSKFDALQNAQTESVTFLGTPDSGGSLYAIPGLDYVSHEDIVPYITSDQHPIQNDLFEKFFLYDNESGELPANLYT